MCTHKVTDPSMELEKAQGVSPYIVINTVPIKATATGVFPPELWLEVGKNLEEKDDRDSLLVLMRCNSKFNSMLRPELYKRFITNNKELTKPRSLTGFMYSVVAAPWVAQFTKVLKVRTILPPDARFTEDGTIIPLFRRSINDLPTTDPLQIHGIVSALLVELLPTLLPKLEKLDCPWGNNGSGVMAPRTWSYLRTWVEQDDANRLTSLKELTITKNATDHCFELFHVAEQVAVAAPNVKKLDVNIYNLGNRPFENKMVKPFTEVDSVVAFAEKLRDLHIKTDDYSEFGEAFFFLSRCRNVQSVLLCLQRPVYPHIGQPEIDQLDRNDMCWELAPRCLQQANPASLVPAPANPDRPPWGGLFTLRHHQNLKHVTVSQNTVMFSAIMRLERDILNDKLVGFLPESMETLCLVGVTTILVPSLRKFAQHMAQGWYPNLKKIELEQIWSTSANGYLVKRRFVLKDSQSIVNLFSNQ
ncbi:hypothetical protein F4806DRAFT_191849 [Annulohypoxylon nitens]|nr:hypothetical protein F4806DRAFT_191849 [Annulohypoxylon nitens]